METHICGVSSSQSACAGTGGGCCRKVYIISYKLTIICIPQAARHNSKLQRILYNSLINTDTCMYVYIYTDKLIYIHTYCKMQSLSSDWPCTNLSFQTILNHSLKCGKLFLMNHTDHHMERKFCHKSLLTSESCFKEKLNIFQCFNVPFINDDLLLGEGGGWVGRNRDSYPGVSPPFLA